MKAETIKQHIDPAEFYLSEIPTMPPPKRDGWNNAGKCPFHDDTHAGSFRVHTESGAFKCFACDAKGGDIISFTMQREGLNFRAALDRLRDEWRVRL